MSEKGIAIVTGASGGMGKEFVRLLACDENISEIWAIARNEGKLNDLKTEIGDKVRSVVADLTDTDAVKGIEQLIKAERPNIRFAINNAGYAKFCAYNDISIDESLNMIDLNVKAVVAITLLCIPYMKSGAHILNIASQASFQPLPYMNIYAATKAFVRNYTRALNVELGERGISATAVCPGWMDTDLYARGNVGAKKGANVFKGMLSPQKVAIKALRDACKNKDISVCGLRVKAEHGAAKIFSQKTMMKLWLRQQKIK